MTQVGSVNQILRVDHAGERGAISIYRAQLLVSKALNRRCVPALQEMLEHEYRHHQAFESLLKARGVGHCYAITLWALGGFVLGTITALLGERAIWVCTSAIENTVNEHLEHQVAFLASADPEALAAVESIRFDEQAHEEHAVNNGGASGGLYRILHGIVRGVTSFAIWLSTKL
ncbi:demethoxyubiquinone hydroxylase family protein [Solimonas marina]|uniref:Demethoxyubiquinone hydroxylase family protein n=1 Tax=Solimonas marina TaxID=2714601 RepID=A0A970B6C7_9GAMM|nr:demethoxyubiquinone hydroxylase family protein [Solimonas marina]NKF24322.1 demethoxyubiquinone hydroxylase family protein [Solimonas marina]